MGNRSMVGVVFSTPTILCRGHMYQEGENTEGKSY